MPEEKNNKLDEIEDKKKLRKIVLDYIGEKDKVSPKKNESNPPDYKFKSFTLTKGHLQSGVPCGA